MRNWWIRMRGVQPADAPLMIRAYCCARSYAAPSASGVLRPQDSFLPRTRRARWQVRPVRARIPVAPDHCACPCCTARDTGVKAAYLPLSSGGVELIARQSSRVAVTCDVSRTMCTLEMISLLRSNCHCPPLRSLRDRAALPRGCWTAR